MIAADTPILIDYFQGKIDARTDKLDEALACGSLILPPVVLAEIMSDPYLPKHFLETILELPILELKKDYWHRAGVTRSKLILKKLKARLADTLIAQSCIDHDTPLITQNGDFRHFVKHCGLIVIP